MAKPLPLPVWDRRAGKLFEEFMDDAPTTYESRPRHSLMQWLESQPVYDRLYAKTQDWARSARKIGPFVKKHQIDLSEFEPVEYRCYADFFLRRFRPGVRCFPDSPSVMGAFAEARYFGWERIDPDQRFPIKGSSLNAETILGSAQRAAAFSGGPVLIARLAPVDYHRMHYFDAGKTLEQDRLGKRLWTVNWRALLSKDDVLFVNERTINILDTANFGRIAFVEIGALTVGRVVQVHPIDRPFARGDEKSFFCFGGSAIVVLGQPNVWRPSDDILERTRDGVETLVRLGDHIAHAASP